MIGARSLNARIELQAHHRWLSSFLSRHATYVNGSPGCYRGFSEVVFSRDDNHNRRLPRQYSLQRQTWTAHFATKRAKVRKVANLDEKTAKGVLILKELRQAVQAQQVESVAELYHSLSDKSLIKPNDFLGIAQCVHHVLRTVRSSPDARKRSEDTTALAALVKTLVEDLVKGELAPHHQAHVHLLSFFKESGARDEGVDFWHWLENQNELYVNPAVYGAAIELLALNGTSLRELEDLYVQALDRFPGTFSAYHLSPEAFVPDADQQTTASGIPTSLVQGILTARLFHSDTTKAYQALDTILRLYPDQVPPRFFQLFLEERPLLEGYTVFAIAFRGGNVVSLHYFKQLIAALRTSSDLSSPVRHSVAIRGMLSASYLYIGAGGRVTENVLNEIIITVTKFLRLEGVNDLTAKQKQKISLELMKLIRPLFLVFARYGVRPGLTPFNSIIANLGGFGLSKEIVGIALADIKGLGLQPNKVTRRSILTAAGALGDAEFVRQAWDELVEDRMKHGQNLDATDFYVLIKNATVTEQRDFARLQFEKWKKEIPTPDDHHGIEEAIREYTDEHRSDQGVEALDVSSIFSEIEKIGADLPILQSKTEHNPRVLDFRDERLPMTLLQTASELSLPEAEMRRFYDELTTENLQSQPDHSGSEPGSVQPPSSTEFDPDAITKTDRLDPGAEDGETMVTTSRSLSPALSPTNIPFGTLRYENWKTINQLMELAKTNDELYLKAVDAAIAAGVVPPRRSMGLILESHGKPESYGLSDVMSAEQSTKRANEKLDAVQIQETRNKILKLRGRLS